MKTLQYIAMAAILGASPLVGQEKEAGQEGVKEGAASTLGVVGISNRRLVIFSPEKPEGPPRLMIYKPIPKANEVTNVPLLLPEFIKSKDNEKDESAKVRPEKVMLEEAKKRRKTRSGQQAEDEVDDGEQTGESSKQEFDDDDIDY